MVGWGGQLGGIQNQPGGFDEKRLVTLGKTSGFKIKKLVKNIV